jgi:glycosyltransferase involved in cell wall biosynthesis
MKILIVQDHLRVGGTERQSLMLARVFESLGHRSVILLFRPGGHLAHSEQAAGLETEVLQRFNSGISLWAPGLGRRIRRIGPDVILCMGRTANCYAGWLQKSFPGTPVVGTLRTGKMVFPLHHWSMGHVRAVLVNSNWWKRRLLERAFPEERIHVVHNSLLLDRDHGQYREQGEKMRQSYGVPEDSCVFLNVATFRSGKRHMELLKLFARLRQQRPDLAWRLWLVGDGREYRRCKRWAAENGLGTRVRFFHFQPDPFPFYAAADVAVSVSREDSLPNFLIEAQAAGLPVLAYECRGVNETCLPGKTGQILEAGDSGGMLKALGEFAADPALREAFGREAPAFARERFSRQTQAESVLHFLEKLVNAPM